jgi:hypothetical protein
MPKAESSCPNGEDNLTGINPTTRKLGLKRGMHALVVAAPSGYLTAARALKRSTQVPE